MSKKKAKKLLSKEAIRQITRQYKDNPGIAAMAAMVEEHRKEVRSRRANEI
jgi:hypothetical protein